MASHRLGHAAGFRLVVAIVFFAILASNAPGPLYVVWQEKWRFSSLVTTEVFAIFAVSLLATLLLVGGLSDAVGRRPVLVAAAGAGVLSCTSFVVADGTIWLFLARLLQGVSTGLLAGAGTAALVELDATGDSRRASLFNTIAVMTGSATGPLVVGVLAQYAPAPTVLPFVLEACVIATVLALLLFLPETAPQALQRRLDVAAGEVPIVSRSLGDFVQRPGIPGSMRVSFWLAALSLAVTWAIGSFWAALSSSVARDLLHNTSHVLAGVVLFGYFGIAGIVQMFLRGWGSARSMVIGVPATAAGLGLLELSVTTGWMPALLVGIVVGGVGAGLSFMGSLALIVEMAPTLQRAEVVSAYNVVGYLAVAIPVVGVGLLASHVGLKTATGLFALVAIASSLALTVALVQRLPRRQDAPADVPTVLPELTSAGD